MNSEDIIKFAKKAKANTAFNRIEEAVNPNETMMKFTLLFQPTVLFIGTLLVSTILAVDADTLDVTGSTDANALVDILVGPNSGLTISNVQLIGGTGCAGTFVGGTNVKNIGFIYSLSPFMEDGIVLSSGLAENLEGPNDNRYSEKIEFSDSDTDLNSLIASNNTYDTCVLQFDFTCDAGVSNDISFNYIFASEEYPSKYNDDYWRVDEGFNDVMGVFLNGQNIAFLPDGLSTPVAILNVNENTNSEYYIKNGNDDNECDYCYYYCNDDPYLCDCYNCYDIEADGFTEKLTAAAPVQVGVNTIKFAITNVKDNALDSWLLIESGSLACSASSDFCSAHKGCHAQNPDKRSMCHTHTQGSEPQTLCLPKEAIAAHLEQHPNDYCGPCI